MEENEFITFCKCGCGNGIVLKVINKDEEVSLQIVNDNYYTIQYKVRKYL